MGNDPVLWSGAIRKFIPAVMCLCLALPASAATLEGTTLPDRYTVDGQPLVLNGIGLRTLTILHVKVYVAGLYLTQQAHDSTQILKSPGPKVIIMKFLRDASKADVEKQYRAGEAANCGHGECAKEDEADFEKMVAAAPGVSAGDTFTYEFTRKGLRLLMNGKLVGDYPNMDLAYHFLAAFISEHAPSQELRAQLLGVPPQ
jgi:hypothetical protein